MVHPMMVHPQDSSEAQEPYATLGNQFSHEDFVVVTQLGIIFQPFLQPTDLRQDLLLGTKTTSFLKGKGILLCPSFSYIFSAFCIKRCSSCDISIVSLATVKVLYHVLKLGVNFDKGAYSLRSMATTSQKTVYCSTNARS